MTEPVLNYNNAINTSFYLEIPGFETLNYFVQSCELPGLMLTGIRTDFRNWQVVLQGNKVEYDPLNLSFIVDENFKNHQMLHLWMLRIQHGDSSLISDEMKDISLHLLSSNKTENRKVNFYKAFPTMLSPLPLNSDTSDTSPIVCTCTFAFQYYEFVD